jgi:hypothetical protein
MPWLKRIVACLPPRRHWFAAGLGHVGFVTDKVSLVFSEFFLFVLSLSSHRGFPRSYRLGVEQYPGWWPHFGGIVSPHRHGQQQIQIQLIHSFPLIFFPFYRIVSDGRAFTLYSKCTQTCLSCATYVSEKYAASLFRYISTDDDCNIDNSLCLPFYTVR